MVSPAFKATTTFAKDPKVITAAGMVILGAFTTWKDLLLERINDEDAPKDVDLDWLEDQFLKS